jgi:hypothetical protein
LDGGTIWTSLLRWGLTISECDIILDTMPRISTSLFLNYNADNSAVLIAMLAIYALITNPLLLFVMVRLTLFLTTDFRYLSWEGCSQLDVSTVVISASVPSNSPLPNFTLVSAYPANQTLMQTGLFIVSVPLFFLASPISTGTLPIVL